MQDPSVPSRTDSAGGSGLLSPWDLVRVARLGLIASHLWLFSLPVILAGGGAGPTFWIGAAYVTVPLGLLIYGWNDFFDADVDAISRRKKGNRMSRFFGYRLSPRKRRRLPFYIVALNLPFVAAALVAGEFFFLGWMALMVVANWLYNGPGPRLSRVPVIAELVATGIYLNIVWLSVTLTGLPQPWEVWVLAGAAILVFQIGGAIVDIKSDREVGKVTFAAWVGEVWAARALSAVVAAKAAVLLAAFSALAPALLNLLAVPLCLGRPAIGSLHWSGLAYVLFVLIDWVVLGLLTS